MKILKYIVFVFLVFLSINISGQENTTMPERTPEQEAAKQTEKMQQELKLTPEQARQIHEINLKYARARKVSNSRSDAIQRIKDKEADLSRVLNDMQRSVLQNKRYERSSFQTAPDNRQGNYQNQRQPVENPGSQAGRQAAEAQGQRPETQTQRTEAQNQGTDAQQPTTRSYSPDNFRSSYRNTAPNTGSYRTGTPSATQVPRSTYRSSTDYRSSVRSAPSSGSSTRSSTSGSGSSGSSGSGSSGRSSSSTQQPSNSGRR